MSPHDPTPKIIDFHHKFFNVFARLFPGLLHLHYGLAQKESSWLPGMFKRLKQGSVHLLETLAQETSMADWSQDSKGLDIGCGLAGTAIFLHQHFGFQMNGINITPEQVLLAQQRVSQHQLEESIQIVQGDALDLPYPERSFDFVTMIEVAFHIQDKDKIFQEIQRILKPGGIFILIDQECTEDLSVMNLFYFVKYGTYHTLMEQNNFRLLQEKDLSLQVANWMKDYARASRLPFHLLVCAYAFLCLKPQLAWDYLKGIFYFNRLILQEVSLRQVLPKQSWKWLTNGIYGLRTFTRQELLSQQTRYQLFIMEKNKIP